MSILDLEFENKMNSLRKKNNINEDYFKKSKQFKIILDDFKLINNISNVEFIKIYKKSFSSVLDFEIKNNFNYSYNHINDIEDNLEKINLQNLEYNNILDYMILKCCDLDSEYYGSVINFINIIFNQINNYDFILKQISSLFEEEPLDLIRSSSNIERINEIKNLLLDVVDEDNINEIKNKLDFSNLVDINEFLIFTSQNSDFYIEELKNENIQEKLFDNQKEIYKKSGYNLLENIKNKIISYN